MGYSRVTYFYVSSYFKVHYKRKGDSMALTEKQQRFADYYIQSGNATESYKKAYESCKKDSVARANSSRLLTNANVIQYVAQINKEIKNDRIADMVEVKEFWTQTMRDKEVDRKDRLKASELIGKTNGAFIDKVEGKLEVTLPNIIVSK